MPLQKAADLFRTTFRNEPTVAAHAPGRINLIGEHTDYNDGFVFPVAIDRGVSLVARPNGLDHCRLVSDKRGRGRPFTIGTLKADLGGWVVYPAGMAWALGAKTPVDVAVTSNLPVASGVSSSAALEMAFAVLWNELDALGHDAQTLALLAQKCENEYVGVNCGIMDMTASARGKKGHAMFLDTRTLDIEYAPLPDGLAIVLCDTGKPRSLSDSAYNERREQCEAAARAMGVASLRDAAIDQLERVTDPVARRRARHVLTENDRCHQFKKALQHGQTEELGRLLAQSHASLRDDYEVSCTELDVMVAASLASPGCIGARMTGAGFGGACVALIETQKSEEFEKSVEQRYKMEVLTYESQTMVCQAVDGASIVPVPTK